MPYFLKHYFDPYYNHLEAKPKQDSDGHADNFNLGYVHNVVKGQVLAELVEFTENNVPPEAAAHPDMIVAEPVLPQGSNTGIAPDNPLRLISELNGYVYYNDGLIHTKRILNMRQGINFHTGNIVFLGDVAVHDVVSSGFVLRAGGNVIIKGLIEGAFIRASGGIVGDKGFKGSEIGKIISCRDIRLSFAENGELRSRGKLVVDGSCLHCNLYCHDVVVRGRLHGGSAYVKNVLFVTSRLGNEGATPTDVFLGQEPELYRDMKKAEAEALRLSAIRAEYQAKCEKSENLALKYQPLLDRIETKFRLAQRMLLHYRKELELHSDLTRCRLIVPGKVMPGVTIHFGETSLRVDRVYENVTFFLEDDHVAFRHPAVTPDKPASAHP